MRVNLLIAMIIFALIWPATALRAAVSKTTGRMLRHASLCLSKTTQTTTFSSRTAGRWIRA
ncbi:hypothetical protein ECZU17_31800 [Escherichia coli]|nr:hypothetical protein ECZU17_31800 [Escherichia coli]